MMEHESERSAQARLDSRPGLTIRRTASGFEVGGDEHFFHRTSPDFLEKVLSEVVLPIARENPTLTLRELIQQTEQAVSEHVPARRPISWTGLHLLVEWKSAEQESSPPAFDRVVELLREWDEAVRPARAQPEEVGVQSH